MTRGKLFVKVKSQNLCRKTGKFCFFMAIEIPENPATATSCGLEGVGGRPPDCKNNPWRYPKNHRPDLCRQCPADPEIAKVAKHSLPHVYVIFKQTKGKD